MPCTIYKQKVVSYLLAIVLQIQNFIKVFQYILKSTEMFLIQNYVYSNTKKKQIKQTSKNKNRDKFWHDNIFQNWKKLNYFNKTQNSYFLTYCQNLIQTRGLKTLTLLDMAYLTLTSFFIKKCFNDPQNWNFSVLWLKWTQTLKMKQIHTFFDGNIEIWRHIFFDQKILKYFNDFKNRNFSVLWVKWTHPM